MAGRSGAGRGGALPRGGRTGRAVANPDILERREVAAGRYREHRSPHPPAGGERETAGGCPGATGVKSEEGGSPPPRHPGDTALPPPNRGCSVAEPEPNPGAGNGGFVPPSPAFESRWCRLECAECGRGFAPKPDPLRHELARGGEQAHACARCRSGFSETAGPGTAGGHYRATSTPRKERKELSLPEKVRVLAMLEGPKVSQSELAKRFGVSQPQICRIIKNKERILSEWHRGGGGGGEPERKRKREGKDAALEAALLHWVEGARADDLPAADPVLQLDAEPGAGWLARFGAGRNLAVEKPPAAEEGDAEQRTAERWAGTVLPGLLRGYAPSEVYACGETGVVLPAGSSGAGESAGDRLTLLLCANADGSEKAPLRAVGENPRPRCLRGVNLGQMPWSYRAGSRAAVTAALFAEWLREFDEGMRRRGKSVLLLLAKHEAHPYLRLANVRVVFTPPAAAQPLDRGVAGDLKAHYRRRLLRRLAAERGAGQPTLLDALHMLTQAWGDVRPGLIAGCFRASGISPDAEIPAVGPERPERRGRMSEEPERDKELADGDEGTAEGEEVGEVVAAARPCPSEREVWGSLATLRRYLECRATSPDIFHAFYELEDAVDVVAAGAAPVFFGDSPPKQ